MDELYETFLEAVCSNTALADAMKILKDETPPPMNTMFEKQSKAEAIKKWSQEKQ